MDRPLPGLARALRSWTLRRADLVAARSPAAGERAREWGARGEIELVPHAVPSWNDLPPRQRPDVFTIGFAGRLVEEKGVHDLLAAARRLAGPVRVLFAGNGPLRNELAGAGSGDVEIAILSDLNHDRMGEAYAEMDVLVLPSRTTETWTEQFGRVLVEALWCGVPVIGASSGEIPWVVSATGGGMTFPEGDVDALATAIAELRDRPDVRGELAAIGKESVERMFAVDAVANLLDELLLRLVERTSLKRRGRT